MQMYFLAHVLPPHLNEKVIPFKNHMHEKYGCKVGLKSPAHITLVPPFWMEEELETGLRSAMDKLTMDLNPFLLSTSNFSAFPPKTIFIGLVPNPELAAAKKMTEKFFRDLAAFPMKFDDRPFHPHITIATRDLYKKDFKEAWPGFEQKVFREEWMVEDFSLLRHNKKNWEVVHTSQFRKN